MCGVNNGIRLRRVVDGNNCRSPEAPIFKTQANDLVQCDSGRKINNRILSLWSSGRKKNQALCFLCTYVCIAFSLATSNSQKLITTYTMPPTTTAAVLQSQSRAWRWNHNGFSISMGPGLSDFSRCSCYWTCPKLIVTAGTLLIANTKMGEINLRDRCLNLHAYTEKTGVQVWQVYREFVLPYACSASLPSMLCHSSSHWEYYCDVLHLLNCVC